MMSNLSDYLDELFQRCEENGCNEDCPNCKHRDECFDAQDNSNFVYKANNVYRTKKYIVKQELSLDTENEFGTHTVSCDTFYERTEARDKKYEKYFAGRRYIDGRRVPSMVYMRKYIK